MERTLKHRRGTDQSTSVAFLKSELDESLEDSGMQFLLQFHILGNPSLLHNSSCMLPSMRCLALLIHMHQLLVNQQNMVHLITLVHSCNWEIFSLSCVHRQFHRITGGELIMLLVYWGASCLCQETHLSTLHLTSLQLLQLTFQELQAYRLVLKFTLQWSHYRICLSNLELKHMSQSLWWCGLPRAGNLAAPCCPLVFWPSSARWDVWPNTFLTRASSLTIANKAGPLAKLFLRVLGTYKWICWLLSADLEHLQGFPCALAFKVYLIFETIYMHINYFSRDSQAE